MYFGIDTKSFRLEPEKENHFTKRFPALSTIPGATTRTGTYFRMYQGNHKVCRRFGIVCKISILEIFQSVFFSIWKTKTYGNVCEMNPNLHFSSLNASETKKTHFLERKTHHFLLQNFDFPNVWIQFWQLVEVFWFFWGSKAIGWTPEIHAARFSIDLEPISNNWFSIIVPIILVATGWIYSNRFGPIAKKNQIHVKLMYLDLGYQGNYSICNSLWEISFWKSWMDWNTLCQPSFESRPDLRIELTCL